MDSPEHATAITDKGVLRPLPESDPTPPKSGQHHGGRLSQKTTIPERKDFQRDYSSLKLRDASKAQIGTLRTLGDPFPGVRSRILEYEVGSQETPAVQNQALGFKALRSSNSDLRTSENSARKKMHRKSASVDSEYIGYLAQRSTLGTLDSQVILAEKNDNLRLDESGQSKLDSGGNNDSGSLAQKRFLGTLDKPTQVDKTITSEHGKSQGNAVCVNPDQPSLACKGLLRKLDTPFQAEERKISSEGKSAQESTLLKQDQDSPVARESISRNPTPASEGETGYLEGSEQVSTVLMNKMSGSLADKDVIENLENPPSEGESEVPQLNPNQNKDVNKSQDSQTSDMESIIDGSSQPLESGTKPTQPIVNPEPQIPASSSTSTVGNVSNLDKGVLKTLPNDGGSPVETASDHSNSGEPQMNHSHHPTVQGSPTDSGRDSVFLHDDFVVSAGSGKDCDPETNSGALEGDPSPQQDNDFCFPPRAEEDDDGTDQEIFSPDNWIPWEGPQNSPLPRNAILRSNSLSLPLSLPKRTLADPIYRRSHPVFQYSVPESAPLVSAVVVNAKGETWSHSHPPSKSESDLRLLGEESDLLSMSRESLSDSQSSPAANPANTLETFVNRTHEGSLWLNNTAQRTQVKRWCIIQRGSLIMFESNHPRSRVIEQWWLPECKVYLAPQKVTVDLLVNFSAHHAFLVKRTEKKTKAIFSTQMDFLCKEWLQKMTAASKAYSKPKASRFSIPSFFHFTKSSRGQRVKDRAASPPRMRKQSFEDIYGWSEMQSHRRVHRATPVEERVQRVKSQRSPRAHPQLVRASSDTNLNNNKGAKEPIDRSSSAETASNKDGGTFGTLRRTLKHLPLGRPDPTPASASKAKKPLAISHSNPLEPSVRTGLLLVKRTTTSWNRCWVKLLGSHIHFFSDRNEDLPFEVVSLRGRTVQCKPTSPNPVGQVRFKFSLVCLEKESIHFLADTELEGRLWVKRFMEACTVSTMGTLDESPVTKLREHGEDSDPNDNNHSDASGSPSESPILHQRKRMIQKRYQEASETEDMNAMKRSLVLTQRRMSAQTKLNALDKRYVQQIAKGSKGGKKRNKSGGGSKESEEPRPDDASIQEMLKELRLKVKGIDKELNENVLRSDQRKQALRKKQEMELEILQQEKELLHYRSQAQAALKKMMVKSRHQPLVEEREPEPHGIGNDTSDRGSDSSYGHLHQTGRYTPSVSSSMSSLSSSSTSDSASSGPGGTRSNPTTVERGPPNSGGTDAVDGPLRHIVPGSPPLGVNGQRVGHDGTHENGGSPVPEMRVADLQAGLDIGPKRRTEVPPDVLRDIDEFEEMAKIALRKAGWLPPDAV